MIEARIRASIEAYVAAWNERDTECRMRLIERGCATGLLLQTPGRRIAGRGQLDELIASFQERRPGECAVFSSAIDVQGRLFRYTGVVRGPTGAPLGETLDAGECDEEGRITLLLTFVGSAPPPPPA